VAQAVAPIGAAILGLAMWLVSTPATILMFTTPGMESFAILINALFFAVLVPLAFEEDIDPAIIIFAGFVGAFAYLNKLSYVYIPIALLVAVLAKVVFTRPGWIKAVWLICLFLFALLSAIVAVAHVIIGWPEFLKVLDYHQNVILATGRYGAGDHNVVSRQELWRAITLIPVQRTFAIPIAIAGGIGLIAGGLVTGFRNAQQTPAAILGIATGIAALAAGTIVMKHYDLHYTAGVSVTLPACMVAGWLLARSWGYRVGLPHAAVVALVVALMADGVSPVQYLKARSDATQAAGADMEEIIGYTAGSTRKVSYAYKAPFSQFGVSFVLQFAGVPRLTYEYLHEKRNPTTSMLQNKVTDDVGFYVIDKGYFPTVEAIRNAENFNLFGSLVRYQEGDKLIPLRTVFLLIRG
jgi:hypothetical protein